MQQRPAWMKGTNIVFCIMVTSDNVLFCPFQHWQLLPVPICPYSQRSSPRVFLRQKLPTCLIFCWYKAHYRKVEHPFSSIAEEKWIVSRVNKSLSTSKPGIVEKGIIQIFSSPKRTYIGMVRESHNTSTNAPGTDLAGLVADVQYWRRRRRNSVQTGGNEEEEEHFKPRAGTPSEGYLKLLMGIEDCGRARG